MIDVLTLGRVDARHAVTGEVVALANQPKCLALLVYLALHDGPVQRDHLLALLWPELDDGRARAALRQLLFRIRHSVSGALEGAGSRGLRVDPSAVRCDAADFGRLLTSGRLREALSLYRGEFLPGFHVSDAPELERWVDTTRARLLDDAVEAAWELVRVAQARGDLPGARTWAEWAMARAPYDEDHLRDYLVILREAGATLEAARAYRAFAARLGEELDAAPRPGTRRLVADVLDRTEAGPPPAPREPSWSQLRVRSRVLSQNTSAAIRRTSGIRWEHHARRPFFRRHLEAFLASPHAATALVAPAGYGKTVGLAQAVDALWLGEAAPESEDVLWFLRMQDLGGLSARGADLGAWLLGQMGLGDDAEYRSHFRMHPDQRRGQLLLILDGLDEHSLRTDLLDDLFARLVALIGSIRDPWFRVVLSTRTSAWRRFVASVGDAPAFWDLWHGVGPGTGMDNPGNVPPLNADEVETVLQSVWRLDDDRRMNPADRSDLLSRDILSHPFYLQLFLQSAPDPVPLDRLDIVERFLERRVHSPPHAEGKLRLMNTFLAETGFGERTRVEKERLIERHGTGPQPYLALLSAGVLVEEEKSVAAGAPARLIRMGQPALFEILLARHWIRERGGASGSLLEELAERYRGSTLRLPVLAWVIRYALRARAFDALEDVFRLPITPTERRDLSRVLGPGLRRSDEARAALVPRWARDPAAQAGYFEAFVDQDYLVPQFMDTLRAYLRHRPDREARIFGHSLLLWGSLQKLDADGSHRAASHLLSLAPDEHVHPLPLGRAMGYMLVYHQNLHGAPPPELLERLLALAERPPRRDDLFRDFPTYHLHAAEALNLCGRWAETLRVVDLARRQFPNLSRYRASTTFHSLLLCHHAMALLRTGSVGAGERILQELTAESALGDPDSYPTYHYSRIHLLRALAESRSQHDDPAGAISPLSEAVRTSEGLGLHFFEVRGLGRLQAVHSLLDQQDQAERCSRRIDRLLDRSGFRQGGATGREVADDLPRPHV